MKAKRYHWQPEPAVFIIYWSLTLIILFYGMTLTLENTGLYWKSYLILGIFVFFAWLGTRRTLYFEGETMVVRYARFWKQNRFDLKRISELVFFPNGIAFSYDGKEMRLLFRKKNLLAFKAELISKYPEEQIRIKNKIEIE
ncbi:EbsA family protein [Enterococcus asini]|uniref:EbsA family protein n=1 Tax=Enterococcus TaxID=1350 RepID=UPI00288CBAD4|nr:EbsA family protein [Enterococcus asini]MDT2757014.1 EbsA family protein [Enterococcus asini]